MQQEARSASQTVTTGRVWVVLANLAMFGGLLAMVVQFFVLKHLDVPWYMAVLGTLGAVLIAVAMFQRRSLFRGLALALFVALTALEWYTLVVLVRLPAYAGPARVGEPIPEFTTTLADGSSFSDRDLRGDPAVLVFFRGRW